MNPITTNYGLKGGTLDATKHLERAIKALCQPGEREQAIIQLQASVEARKLPRN